MFHEPVDLGEPDVPSWMTLLFVSALGFAALLGILGIYQLVEICCGQSFWPRP